MDQRTLKSLKKKSPTVKYWCDKCQRIISQIESLHCKDNGHRVVEIIGFENMERLNGI